ncbi:MAG: NADH-ubiquinone oxidoreductase-F iron-sulfur binding region domain-containing protein [Bacillota bacterium]|nr:NADH-ubiquinone oxidoreductase-F iron-sulfur binding region domain-containing protein [Bacillota bacterium]
MAQIKSPEELEKVRQGILSGRDPSKPSISVCAGSACLASGAAEVIAAFKAEIKKQGLEADVDTKGAGCPGFCERGPVVVIYPEEICYLQVKPEDVSEIVSSTIKEKKVIDRLLYVDPSTGEKAVHEYDIPFYKKQMRLVIGDNIKIDPKSIDDYLAVGGYSALGKVIRSMTPDQVIEEVSKSNLRGRSGSGFPAGFKWESCRKSEGEPKYIICNCHEGDPGAFADRRLLEATPHTVLEGMIIGCYAIGAAEGYIFVGDEFPQTVENARLAIKQAEEYGFLGKNILGSDFDLTIKVYIDGGGYVLGESSSLMASMEGKIGEPRTKYDHATDRGLWAKPTVLNNLQTWVNVPLIINQGADSFSKIGTEESTGTRVFSLTGKVNNIGMVEVPMGMTFREIVFDIGGGIRGNKKFKALQAGGPMGGFIPENLLDLQVDYEEMKKAGLAMGPGLIVADENTCIVDMVKYYLTFLANESCGKCTPCRDGLRHMLKIMNRITEGRGQKGDLELLEILSEVQKSAALCALGQGASDPLRASLKHFRDEYEAHIEEKRCPAGVCKVLSTALNI